MSGKSLKDMMAQKLAQKQGGNQKGSESFGTVKETKKMKSQLPKKPSMAGRKMGI